MEAKLASKKTWARPTLVVFGGVEEITTKPKMKGSGDDLHIQVESCVPGSE